MVKNIHGHTLDILGQAILSGRYAMGASLPPEPLLCEQLGVSRTVVREAIKSLIAKGLLITGPKLGTRVLSDEQWNTELPIAIRELFTEVIKLGGTISGEHGIGLVQKSYMDLAFPEVALELMRNIKKVFDPKGILNPGKVF